MSHGRRLLAYSLLQCAAHVPSRLRACEPLNTPISRLLEPLKEMVGVSNPMFQCKPDVACFALSLAFKVQAWDIGKHHVSPQIPRFFFSRNELKHDVSIRTRWFYGVWKLKAYILCERSSREPPRCRSRHSPGHHLGSQVATHLADAAFQAITRWADRLLTSRKRLTKAMYGLSRSGSRTCWYRRLGLGSSAYERASKGSFEGGGSQNYVTKR